MSTIDAERPRSRKGELDDLRQTNIELLAELRAKTGTIAQLEAEARRARATIERQDKEEELRDRIIDGLRAEVELFKLAEADRKKETLGPLMMGVGGAVLGSMLYGLGSKWAAEHKKDKT